MERISRRSRSPEPIPDTAALVDEIGSLLPAAKRAQKRIKMLQASLSPIRDKIKTLTTLVTADPHHGPNETFTVEGQQFRAIVGKRARLRAVKDVRRAIALLNATKKGLAYEAVKVPLGKLDSYLTPEQVSEVLEIGWANGRWR